MSEPILSHLDVESLKSQQGQEVLVSDWISVSQEEIEAFGRITRDLDPMHVDPEYARQHSPFGTTILFGFQTLAMLSYLCRPLRLETSDRNGYELNYGLNRVRFIAPIPVGRRFRNRMVIKSVEERDDGRYLVTTLNTVEVEGEDRPAVIAEWLGLLVREAAP